MKHYKRDNVYKNSSKTLTFNPETLFGYSYQWYAIVRPHPTKPGVIINNYNYSTTTVKHKYKIMRLCEQLGIEIVDRIEAPRGLNNVESAIQYLEDRIRNNIEYSKKPRIRETTREKLFKECLQLKNNINTLKMIISK